MSRVAVSVVLVGLALVGGAACDMAADAHAKGNVTYNDSAERNAYAFGSPSPERWGVVQKNTQQQRMRYCRQMFGMDGAPPLAPEYRPTPGDLCYSVWKDLYLDPQLARYAGYYKR